MKKITIKTDALKNAVALAKRVALRNADNIDVVCIQGIDGKLSISATDYTEAIVAQNIDYSCTDITDRDFMFQLDLKNLQSVLNTANTEDVSIEIKEELIVLKSGDNKFKIKTIDEELKITKKTKGTKIAIDMKFIESLKIIYHSVDRSNPKYELNSCCIKAEDNKLVVVGTNTRVLAHAVTKVDKISFNEIMIPKTAMKTIIDLFSGLNVEATISSSSLSISTEELYYETKLTNGNFVNWKVILPSSYKHIVKLEKAEFEKMVKNASVFDSSQIHIEISNGKITMSDKEGTAVSSEKFDDTSVNILFCINGSLLLELLSSIKQAKNLELCFNESNLPIAIKIGDSFQEIMMPIVIEKEDQKAA